MVVILSPILRLGADHNSTGLLSSSSFICWRDCEDLLGMPLFWRANGGHCTSYMGYEFAFVFMSDVLIIVQKRANR